MSWAKTDDDKRREAVTYGEEYRRNRKILLQQTGRRCQQCGSNDRIECDHVIPGGGSHISNLQILCRACHGAKTATQRGQASQDPAPRPTTDW